MNGNDELIVLDEAHILITVDRGQSMMVSKWKHYPPSAVYRETMERILSLITQYRLRMWATDQRDRGPILREDELWVTNEFLPRIAASGLVRIAVIESPDFFNRMAVDRMVRKATPMGNYEIGYFPDRASAEEWMIRSAKATA